MPTFTIEAPNGKRLKIEAADEQSAMTGAQQWYDDTDAVVRTVYGEARSDPDSQAGVASVILNRAKATGSAPRDVVMAKGQFEPWGNPQTRAKLEALDPQSPEYQDILNRVQPVLGGEDVTNGATHFYAPKAQTALGRKPPKWDDGSGVDMGQHRFFARPGDFGQAPSRQPTEGAVTATVEGHPEWGTGVSSGRPQAKAVGPQNLPQVKPRPDQGLGFISELARISQRIPQAPNVFDLIPGQADKRQQFEARAQQGGQDYLKQQAAQGVVPGKWGKFGADVLGTAWIPGGPLVSGAASGALMSEAKDPLGVLKDAAIGAVGGKVASKLVGGAGKLLSVPFSKPPAIRSPVELNAAKDAAYDAARAAGVKYKPSTFNGLVLDIEHTLKDMGIDADLNPKAWGMLNIFKKRAGQSPTLDEVDKLRQLVGLNVMDGSKAERRLGASMIASIDDFLKVSGPKQTVAGDPRAGAAALKEGRDLAARSFKVGDVTDAVQRGRNRAASTGSGGNADNAIRQNIRRLLEKSKGLTDDERAAFQKVVEGGPVQNLARLVGKLSPQGNGLMAALGIGGAMTNPLFGIPSLVGLGSKHVADKATQRNVDDLLRLLAVGGSKKALQPVLSPTGRIIQTGTRRAQRPAVAAGAALSVAAASPPKKSR